MGKIHIFTNEQKIILDAVKKIKYLRSSFYFTGGTALSSFYLSHRYSDDLDFFSENKFNNQVLLTLMDQWSSTYNFSFKSRFIELYFLLQKFHVWDLITGVRVKFNREIEPLLLGADFLKVEDFQFLPKMILPLTLEDLKAFFREKAKEMGLKSVE